jgi:hypothetical protein
MEMVKILSEMGGGAELYAQEGGWDNVDQFYEETGLNILDLGGKDLYFPTNETKEIPESELKKLGEVNLFVYVAHSVFIEHIIAYKDREGNLWVEGSKLDEI